jgi:hypothetical protein
MISTIPSGRGAGTAAAQRHRPDFHLFASFSVSPFPCIILPACLHACLPAPPRMNHTNA